MSEQATITKKTQFMEGIKKHFNYPMLLLAIITIFNLRNVISSFIGIFSCLFTAPLSVFSALFTFILSASPVIILLLLWLHRFQKMKNVKVLMGVFLLFIVLLTVYKTYPTIVFFFSNISQYDAYTIYAESPFISVLDIILKLVIYSVSAIILLCNKKVPSIYYIIIVISIIATLFFGILTQMIISMGYMSGSGGLVAAFIDVLTYIAFWYIPKVLNDSSSAELTKSKKKVIIAIAAVVLFIYIVSSIAVGGGSVSNNVSTNTCGSCGRSYKAGDAGGNYMSIAKSGLCKNCNSNREYFEWIFD